MRVQIFIQLQQIDQQLGALAQQRDALLDEFRERDQLRRLRDARRELASLLKEEREHSSDLQWELDDVELRLRTFDEQERDGPTDPLVARELLLLREHAAQLEEHALNQLERIGELEQQLRELEQQVEQATKHWTEHEPMLQQRLDQLGHALETLQTQRQAHAHRLTDSALELYDDLQRRHRGTALAPIRHRQCGACRARLPAAVFDLLNTPDPLVRCPRCGRVVYLDHEPTE